MTKPAISINRLSKTYAGGKRALDDVSFEVPRGQIFGLLGPNGAGKSTLINILAGLVNKTAGTASIWGFDIDAHPRNAKASIGIVNQEILFDPFSPPSRRWRYRPGSMACPRLSAGRWSCCAQCIWRIRPAPIRARCPAA